MPTSAATVKTSASIRQHNWQKLQNFPNKSAVVNEALELFFDRADFLEQKEKEYWDNVRWHLKNKTREYVSLNPDGGDISDDAFEKVLWN
jgi:hypothetical protein